MELDTEKYRLPDGEYPEWFSVFVHCSDWIASALRYAGGTHTINDIADGIAQGRFQLWPGKKAAVVTEIIQYPQSRALHFFLAGGDVNELQMMLAPIEEWAKNMGCQRITLAGRKGWLKSFMSKADYAEKWVVMSKDI